MKWLLLGSVMLAGCQDLSPNELEAAASGCADFSPQTLGRPYFVAVNAYYLQEEGARAIRAGLTTSPPMEEVFEKAKALGVTVIRTWAFNDAPEKAGDSAIQMGPLEYDEIALRGLDLVLARASAHGIQLILPLGNYWNDFGGARQYVAWSGLPNPVEGDPRFCTERRVIDHYREHVRRMLDRTSALEGVRYGDHPAVLAWELLNEPRNRGLDERGDAFRAWVDEVGSLVKSMSNGKWVGTGEEGFDLSYQGYDSAYWRVVAPRLFEHGGNFQKNLQSPSVDFGSIHFFPESWNVDREDVALAGARWIQEHAQLARQLGKPLVLGEFGLKNRGSFSLPQRQALYRGWLTCSKRSGLAGSAPWMFANDSRPDEWDPHTFYFRDGTAPDDPRNRYADIILRAARQN
jgi:mannan endo-1,4-beta-mannosidase